MVSLQTSPFAQSASYRRYYNCTTSSAILTLHHLMLRIYLIIQTIAHSYFIISSSENLIISSRQSHIRAYTYHHSIHHTQKEPIQMKIRILLLHLLIIIASSAPDNRALSPIHT